MERKKKKLLPDTRGNLALLVSCCFPRGRGERGRRWASGGKVLTRILLGGVLKRGQSRILVEGGVLMRGR